MHSRSAIGHEARALRGSDGRTQICFGTFAEDAVVAFAFGRVTGDDDISDAYAGYSLSDAFDDGGGFMAQDAREKPLRIEPVQRINIRVT